MATTTNSHKISTTLSFRHRNGYISAYGLYEHIYSGVKDAVENLGEIQEPELTVLKGVGPFPVALYRGASSMGGFDASELLPADTASREVKVERIQRIFNLYQATLISDGGLAQGNGAVAVGQGGTYIGGDIVGRDKTVSGGERKISIGGSVSGEVALAAVGGPGTAISTIVRKVVARTASECGR